MIKDCRYYDGNYVGFDGKEYVSDGTMWALMAVVCDPLKKGKLNPVGFLNKKYGLNDSLDNLLKGDDSYVIFYSGYEANNSEICKINLDIEGFRGLIPIQISDFNKKKSIFDNLR